MIQLPFEEGRRGRTGADLLNVLAASEGVTRADQTVERTTDVRPPTGGENTGLRHASRRNGVRHDGESGDPTVATVDGGGG